MATCFVVAALNRRHWSQIALAVLVSIGAVAGAVGLGRWVSETSRPIAVPCSRARLPYRVAYRIEGCAIDVASVGYSEERGRALAVFLPLRDASTGEPSGIVLRTTDGDTLDWAMGAEPSERVRTLLSATTFRAGRTALPTNEREVPWDTRDVLGLSGRMEVLDAGDTAHDWWVIVAALVALGSASLGGVVVVIRNAREEERRRAHRDRWTAAFDDAMRDGARSLDIDDPRTALEDFRRAFDAAHELEPTNGQKTVEALLGAAKARVQAGSVEEARETLTRALGYLAGFRSRDSNNAVLTRRAKEALAALDRERSASHASG